MYLDDLNLLCCPVTAEPLELIDAVTDLDGEVVLGELRSVPSGKLYPIRNGIPRFRTTMCLQQRLGLQMDPDRSGQRA